MIQLRGHHIDFIRDLIFGEIWTEELKIYPTSRDLIIAVERARKQKALLRDIYRNTALPTAEVIVRNIRQTPNLEIQVIIGQDDICANCCFKVPCSNGDYQPIMDSYRGCGDPLAQLEGYTPEKGDAESLREMGVEARQMPYPAKALFHL